ncbi:hypothetical protein MKK51_12990 [Methylobacterium sp. E-045]|nr:hypothetical protein [Methylobacterium sp. E-045]
MAVFPEGCSYRAAAQAALTGDDKRTYCGYVSAADENIRAAVSSGLGVGILPQSAISKEHVILGEGDGFPPLPDVHLLMIQASKKDGIRRMADVLRRSSGSTFGHNIVFA